MLASNPACMVNQIPADLGIPNRFNLTPSRSNAPVAAVATAPCAKPRTARRVQAFMIFSLFVTQPQMPILTAHSGEPVGNLLGVSKPADANFQP